MLDQQDGENLRAASSVPEQGQEQYVEWEDNAEYVTVRPAFWRVLRALVAVLILAVIGYVVYTQVSKWVAVQLDPEGEPGANVEVTIPSGAVNKNIAEILEDSGVIPNSTFFEYYAQWNDIDGFQAGDYTFQENMSAEEAIARLYEGPAEIVTGDFIVPEGLWVTEMLPRIASQIPTVTEADLIAALESGQLETRYRPDDCESRLAAEGVEIPLACWDGMLFPAKYSINADATAIEVLAKMNEEFARVTGANGYGGAEQKHDMSAYEVIIIASLIEAEAKTDRDRPLIARVIYNRLQKNEPIGIDATYIYGAQDRQLQITTGILEADTPYSNRFPDQQGLPPNPIAAPGSKSLEAAMNPADGDYFYYVLADTEGNHAFAETLEEHNENVAKARELGLLDS